MVNLQMVRNSFNEIHSSVKLEKGSKVNLQSTTNFSVRMSGDNKRCLAIITQNVFCPENPEQFEINLCGEAEYVCEGIESDDEKKEAHLLAQTMFFPYVQNMVRDLSINAGLNPLIIECPIMGKDEVKLEGKEVK